MITLKKYIFVSYGVLVRLSWNFCKTCAQSQDSYEYPQLKVIPKKYLQNLTEVTLCSGQFVMTVFSI